MKKRFLLLKACGSEDETLEAMTVKSQAELYGMETHESCINNLDDLKQALNDFGKFNYIYLSSHGNSEGFANECGSIQMSWMKFGELVCNSECLTDGSIFMLSCCRGGLNEVAYDMFWNCMSIEYVVGPRQSLTSAEMLVGFHVLLYNLEYRNIDPVVACQKVLNGTDIRFKCFDRMETISELAFINHSETLEKKWKEESIL